MDLTLKESSPPTDTPRKDNPGAPALKLEPVIQRSAGPEPTPLRAPPLLAVGTVLAAQAQRDRASGQLDLLLAGRRWPVLPGDAAREVVDGARVQVRVLRTQPDLELALIGHRGELGAALRNQLPQQANPLRLLANLQWLATDPEGRQAPLPAAVRAAAQAVWQALPQVQSLGDAATLERAMLNSGAGLERLLAAGSADELALAIGADWKAALHKLREVIIRSGGRRSSALGEPAVAPLPTRHAPLQALQTEPPSLAQTDDGGVALGELARQTQESIARVNCNQLSSLSDSAAASVPWLLEIPLRDGNEARLLRLRVGRDTEAASAGTPSWSVEFAIELGERGALQGRVGWQGGRVNVTLQAADAVLAQELDAARGELAAALADAGLRVGKLACLRRQPVEPLPVGSAGPSLIDLRA